MLGTNQTKLRFLCDGGPGWRRHAALVGAGGGLLAGVSQLIGSRCFTGVTGRQAANICPHKHDVRCEDPRQVFPCSFFVNLRMSTYFADLCVVLN